LGKEDPGKVSKMADRMSQPIAGRKEGLSLFNKKISAILGIDSFRVIERSPGRGPFI
jgi:hypothetical protein